MERKVEAPTTIILFPFLLVVPAEESVNAFVVAPPLPLELSLKSGASSCGFGGTVGHFPTTNPIDGGGDDDDDDGAPLGWLPSLVVGRTFGACVSPPLAAIGDMDGEAGAKEGVSGNDDGGVGDDAGALLGLFPLGVGAFGAFVCPL